MRMHDPEATRHLALCRAQFAGERGNGHLSTKFPRPDPDIGPDSSRCDHQRKSHSCVPFHSSSVILHLHGDAVVERIGVKRGWGVGVGGRPDLCWAL
jgi:hypothetical protein